MNTKKDDLFFIIRLGIYLFTLLMVGSYVFFKIGNVEFIRVEYIGQVLFMVVIVILGGIIGLTDCIFRISSSKLKSLFTAIIFYIISLILFSTVTFNPLQSILVFVSYTILFFLLSFVVYSSVKCLQKIESKKYEKCIELLKEKQH